MMKVCVECEIEFDTDSLAKKLAGGHINNCPDCSKETVVKYVGLQAADGKQSQTTILSFSSNEDRSKYVAFWQNNSGLHKNKGCQLGNHLSTSPNIQFKTVVHHNPTNHKGKM